MFRSALEIMHEAVCLCDDAGAVLYMNSAANKRQIHYEDGHIHCIQCMDGFDNY
jgi:hypothetical protein